MKAIPVGLILTLIVLSGCDEGYIIKHQSVGSASIVAVDGSIRTVLVNDKGKFCSEPPPDAIGTIAKAIAMKAAAKAPTKVGTIEGTGEFTRSFESDIHDLFQRSQGVQVLRDGMYRLCEAYVNGAIDQQIYAEQMIDLISTLDFVVPMELCVKLASEERKEGTSGKDDAGVVVAAPALAAAPGVASPATAGTPSAGDKKEDALKSFTSYHKQPIDPLMSNCFKATSQFAMDHNQAVVNRASINLESQKALVLRSILKKDHN